MTAPLTCGPDAPPRGRVYLFARRTSWVPPQTAARFDGVIVATRSGSAAKPNRSPKWWRDVRDAGVSLSGWDWMLAPTTWRPGLAEHISWLAGNGASALVCNVEPTRPGDPDDWRGQHAALRSYMETARALCDRHRLALWVTSWALPPESFPLAELCEHADRAIPQPYGVHGKGGAAYVASVLERWRDAGARDLVCGRGAHELDKSDSDAWRTAAEIAQHRASTPAGYDEAWWPAAGRLPADVLDAITAPADRLAALAAGVG